MKPNKTFLKAEWRANHLPRPRAMPGPHSPAGPFEPCMIRWGQGLGGGGKVLHQFKGIWTWTRQGSHPLTSDLPMNTNLLCRELHGAHVIHSFIHSHVPKHVLHVSHFCRDPFSAPPHQGPHSPHRSQACHQTSTGGLEGP